MGHNKLGFYPADILLPKVSDMSKWSVVACDQYTSEPSYWQARKDEIGDAPSTMKLMLPEIYLEEPDVDQRILEINHEMEKCLAQGIMEEHKSSFVYLQRTQANGKVRHGLIGKIDLEDYSYIPGDKTLIRATEGTIISRIPPRVKVRENAALEFPHIMLLVDDREDLLLGSVKKVQDGLPVVYDFDLCGGGGHSKGQLVQGDALDGVFQALEQLCSKEDFNRKYGLEDQDVLLFAVGDGNHSLATAKEHWERTKKAHPELAGTDHPARYALVEVVNIHDDSLEFEPIHRVIFDTDPAELLAFLENENQSAEVTYDVPCVYGDKEVSVKLDASKSGLAVGALQNCLDSYLSSHPGRIDYIHGSDVVDDLCCQPNTIGFKLPAIEKSSLFKGVILDGVLPRKTFSMGEAHDKRFYLEGRRIR